MKNAKARKNKDEISGCILHNQKGRKKYSIFITGKTANRLKKKRAFNMPMI